MIDRIPISEVRTRYDQQNEIWPQSDAWHIHLRRQYVSFIDSVVMYLIGVNRCIVNIGSAGDEYSISGDPHVHIDLSRKLLPKNGRSLIADAHSLPIRDNSADLVLAIGSVINYCSPIEIISEASRVTKQNAYFLFDFEQSDAFEHIGDENRGKASFLKITKYDGRSERLWYYSGNLIFTTLQNAGFQLNSIRPVHILSSLMYGLTQNQSLSDRLSKYDRLVRKIPILNKKASSFIILAQKHF